MDCLFRREYEPNELLASHPPKLKHPLKQLVFDACCPKGTVHRGSIVVTRWRAAALPELVLAPTEVAAVPGFYDYAGSGGGVWHVNFADQRLFVAYGSSLLAQDELQAAEHPLLGSIREALLAEGQPALTEQDFRPTPVLVTGVERRCTIATEPNRGAGRPLGLYGNRFAVAPPDVVRRALTIHDYPSRTNLVCMAAPAGGHGPYFREQIKEILVTAYTGFAAAVAESQGVPVEIRTGFWGCGAFGGNRHAMTLLQLLAARLAGVGHMRFHVSDDSGIEDFHVGAADLVRVLPGEPTLDALLERIAHLDYEWATSDGN
jgi:Poly (ADP-ribose) glycohydrolase (PARG)